MFLGDSANSLPGGAAANYEYQMDWPGSYRAPSVTWPTSNDLTTEFPSINPQGTGVFVSESMLTAIQNRLSHLERKIEGVDTRTAAAEAKVAAISVQAEATNAKLADLGTQAAEAVAVAEAARDEVGAAAVTVSKETSAKKSSVIVSHKQACEGSGLTQ